MLSAPSIGRPRSPILSSRSHEGRSLDVKFSNPLGQSGRAQDASSRIVLEELAIGRDRFDRRGVLLC